MKIEKVIFVALFSLLFTFYARAEKIVVKKGKSTIQSAIDAAKEGDRIEVRSGTYKENLVITAKSNLTLYAKGKVTIDGQGLAPLTVASSANISVEGFKIKIFSSPANLTGVVDIIDSADITIAKCVVSGGGYAGIDINNSVNTHVQKCTVTNVARTEGDGAGVQAYNGSDGLLVEKCKFTKCPDRGVWADDNVTGVFITESTFIGSSPMATGVELWSAGNLVSQCVFERGAAGVVLYENVEASILENQFRYVEQVAIFLREATSVTVANNVVKGWPGAIGLVAEDTSGSCQIIGNKFQKFDAYALITAGDDSNIIGNKITKFRKGTLSVGMHLNATGQSVLDNTVIGAGSTGILVSEGGNTLVGNTATGCGVADCWDTDNTANTYLFNTFPLVNW